MTIEKTISKDDVYLIKNGQKYWRLIDGKLKWLALVDYKVDHKYGRKWENLWIIDKLEEEYQILLRKSKLKRILNG